MTGIRIPYALALDNLMPFSRQFQKLSKRCCSLRCWNFPVSCSHYHDVFGTFDLLTDMLVLLCGCLIY